MATVPHKNIFVSAVTSEFSSHRKALGKYLQGPYRGVKVQEDFLVSGKTTLQKLDAYVRGCDAVIHLIGDVTGAIARPAEVTWLLHKYPDLPAKLPPLSTSLALPQPGISYTQWEAYLAIYHNKYCYIYRPDGLSTRQPSADLESEEKKNQEAHYRRIAALGRDRGTFTSEEDLAARVLQALPEILPSGLGSDEGPMRLLRERFPLILSLIVLTGGCLWPKSPWIRGVMVILLLALSVGFLFRRPLSKWTLVAAGLNRIEGWKEHFAAPLPLASGKAFSVAVAHIEDDDDEFVERSLFESLKDLQKMGIEPLRFDRRLRGVARAASSIDAETTAHKKAQEWLEKSKADLLIWGYILPSGKDKKVRIMITPRSVSPLSSMRLLSDDPDGVRPFHVTFHGRWSACAAKG